MLPFRPYASIKNFLRRWEIGPRGKTIVKTGTWSIVAKAAAAANLFLTIPFVLHALGPAQFGAWATLASFVTFAGFLDFGFGNGTMNLVAAAHGRGAASEVGNILREGRRTLLWVAFWLAVAALAAIPLVPWYRLLGMPVAMTGDCRTTASAVVFLIVLAVPLNLANRVLLGLGRGDKAFRWQAIGQILTLGAVIILAKAHASLATLTVAAVATPQLASIANTWLLWRDPVMTMTASSQGTRHYEIAAGIRREGTLFFILQLAAALAFSSDLPLISALRGPTQAGTYAIVQRLFSIIPLGLSLVWTPLWPIYRHALSAGDHGWVVRTLCRSVLLAVLISSMTAITLTLGFDHIIGLWVHHPLVAPTILLAGFSVWYVVDAAGTAIATFLNAAGILQFQAMLAIIFAVTTITAKIFVLKFYGSELLPWVTIFAYTTISLVPTIIFSRKLMRQALAPN